MILRQPNKIETKPLKLVNLPKPSIQSDEILIRVKACGICHTDLHIIEGELTSPKLPIIPGHQIVGLVEETGKQVKNLKKGNRVGVPWVYSTCGACKYCLKKKKTCVIIFVLLVFISMVAILNIWLPKHHLLTNYPVNSLLLKQLPYYVPVLLDIEL